MSVDDFRDTKEETRGAIQTQLRLIAGAGFEPAVRQLPDYRPLARDNPVME